MGFWANVIDEMNYQGISRKELAERAGISYAGIGLGMERDSMPGADTALRISRTLHVSIEYLLTGTELKPARHEAEAKYAGYETLFDDMEHIPEAIRRPILDMIHGIRMGLKEKGRR